MLALAFLLAAAPHASAETRTLKLYFLHTGERAEITYKRNGRYLQSGLRQVNHILRDWRRNEPTNMNPRLLDLLWEVYRASGSRDYIHVVSAYRSPETNAMLRKRSSGVAKKSQHMLGNAIDFFLPDVNLTKLRNVALRMQEGGVGYYPRSGSPFVHLDVGSVRHWPRMSRRELASVFPDGKTLHVPSDGKPMPGYQQALAAYEARKRSGGTIQVADDSRPNRGRGLLAMIFGGGADEEEDNAETQIASTARPARAVQEARTAQQPPARRAEPQREEETPGTILAALPARALPVPRLAPRPQAEVGTPPPGQAPAAETAEQPTPEPQQADVQVALADVPLPTRRPDYTPPAAQDAREEAAPVATAFATPVPRPQPSRSPDVIAELLATQPESQDEDDVPPPAPRPVPARAAGDERPAYALAALSVPVPAQARREDETSRRTIAGDARGEEKPALAAASPRAALLQKDSGISPEMLVSGSVPTTPEKGPRPGPQDAGGARKPMVLPTTATLASRMLSREPMLEAVLPPPAVPAFSPVIAAAPKAVYTTGFRRDLDVADARQFSGRAVTFLSLAKFD